MDRMTARRVTTAVVLAATCAAAVPAALAAGPPQPPRTRIYQTPPKPALRARKLHMVQVQMRINPALTVHAGHFNLTDPDNTTLYSGLDVVCATSATDAPFTNLGMPTLRFALRNGAYRIAKTFTRRHVVVKPAGTRADLKVTLTATVGNRKITGTVAVHGPGCEMPATRYAALLLPAGV